WLRPRRLRASVRPTWSRRGLACGSRATAASPTRVTAAGPTAARDAGELRTSGLGRHCHEIRTSDRRDGRAGAQRERRGRRFEETLALRRARASPCGSICPCFEFRPHVADREAEGVCAGQYLHTR